MYDSCMVYVCLCVCAWCAYIGGMPFTAAGGVGGGGMAFSAGLGFFPSLFGLQFVSTAAAAVVPI